MTAAAAFAESFARAFPDRPAPIGFARVNAVPESVELLDAPMASACAFWRLGATRVFAVGPEHGGCAVGRVTQGFTTELPADDVAVGAMLELEYLDAAEFSSIPTLPPGHQAIVYGPLASFPLTAEAVLVLALPRQAMLIAEALGLMRAGAGGLPVTGRPTCMAIPAAIDAAGSRGSLACTGARVYAAMGPEEMLVVIPAAELEGLAARIDHIISANAAVETLARSRLAALSAL